MKQCYTKARAARRGSGFCPRRLKKASRLRTEKRDFLHRREFPAYGCQVHHTQYAFIPVKDKKGNIVDFKKSPKGQLCIRVIKHPY